MLINKEKSILYVQDAMGHFSCAEGMSPSVVTGDILPTMKVKNTANAL